MALSEDAEKFLRRVRSGLGALKPDEREDIVDELRTHLLDRQAQGSADPLAGFESPEVLAAGFVSERTLQEALVNGTSWSLVHALLVATRESLFGLLVLLPLVILQVTGLVLVVCAALKPFKPGLGLWVGSGNFLVGTGDIPGTTEVLGWSFIPVIAVSGTLLFWAANRGLRLLVRWRLQASKRRL